MPEQTRSETVKAIRKLIGRTQAELAAALGSSTKAVQSYEQGWRNVPVRVMIQLLVLLAINRRGKLDDVPCWKITKCPPKKYKQCPSYTIGGGQFCWFVASRMGCPTGKRTKEDILPCIRCPVIRRLMKNWDVRLPAAGPTDPQAQ